MRRTLVAVVTALAFGCTTVRAPAGAFGDRLESLSGSIAEPQVELWIESGKPVSEEELARARGEAQAALRAALGGRDVAPDALGAAEPLLVARARAVARTGSRRSDQRAATIGIAVGIVLVVVAVVALVILSKDAPRPPKAAPAQGAAVRTASAAAPVRVAAPARAAVPRLAPGAARAGAAVAATPRLAPVPRRVAVPRPAPAPGGFPRAPAPWPYGGVPPYGYASGPNVSIGLELVWVWPPPEPYVWAPVPGSPPAELEDGPYLDTAPYAGPPDEAPWEDAPAPPPAAAPPEAAPDAAPPVELALPAAPPLPLEARGFFAGDETVLELDLVDQRTGKLLWSRVVRDTVDARDARAMRRLVESALARQPWTRAGPAAAVPRG